MARRNTRRRTQGNNQKVPYDPKEQEYQHDQNETPVMSQTEETDQSPTDIPESVWKVYLQAFLEFEGNDHRRLVKGCEKQIAQLERRIARKRNQENHQILADMKELHKKTASIGYTVAGKEIRLMKKYKHALRMLARLDITFLHKMAAGANAEDIAHMPGVVQLLRARSLYEIYKEEYMQYLVGQRIEELMEAEPEKQYPEARGMNRHFILHIGPTNSGKTYQALQRLKQAYHGIYLGPLRLLALEVYEKMKEYGVACTMLTGQECIAEENSRVTASTVEMADFCKVYDIAVKIGRAHV